MWMVLTSARTSYCLGLLITGVVDPPFALDRRDASVDVARCWSCTYVDVNPSSGQVKSNTVFTSCTCRLLCLVQ